MGNGLLVFGYIKDIDLYGTHKGDLRWDFVREEKNGGEKHYFGIQTARDVSGDENIEVIGSSEDFQEWIIEFMET